jgi:hypothetical protein
MIKYRLDKVFYLNQERRTMMKKVLFFLLLLMIMGTGPSVLAGGYGGSSHNPYLSEPVQPQRQRQDSGAYSQSYLNNPDYNQYQTLTKPYITEPRRWYDSEKNYQENYGTRTVEPKSLTNPYQGVRPYSSQELTSPFDDAIPQRPERPTGGQPLTPPSLRSND